MIRKLHNYAHGLDIHLHFASPRKQKSGQKKNKVLREKQEKRLRKMRSVCSEAFSNFLRQTVEDAFNFLPTVWSNST